MGVNRLAEIFILSFEVCCILKSQVSLVVAIETSTASYILRGKNFETPTENIFTVNKRKYLTRLVNPKVKRKKK